MAEKISSNANSIDIFDPENMGDLGRESRARQRHEKKIGGLGAESLPTTPREKIGGSGAEPLRKPLGYSDHY